jgi:tetratricopeptide (TPR) repeat protein
MLKSMAVSIPEQPARRVGKRGVRTRSVVLAAVLVAALAGVGAWLAIGRPAGNAAALVEAAIADRRFEEAKKRLDEWLAHEPASSTAHCLLGRLLLAKEKPQEALAAFNRALSLGHPLEELEGPVGVILARSGRHKDAEPHLLRARSRSPAPDPDIEEALARVFMDSFRFGPALDAVDRWIKAAPQAATPWLWRARIDGRTGAGPDRIAEDYRQALKRDPGSDDARLGLGDTLRQLGRHEEALTEYRVYLERHPDSAETLAAAGLSALEGGNEDQALELLSRAVAADPASAAALDGLAAIALRRRQPAEALSYIDRALALEAFHPDFHYRRALALDRLGKESEATLERAAAERLRREWSELEELRRQLLRSPGDRELQSRLGVWLLEHGRDEEGLEWARKVFGSDPSHRATAAALVRYYEKKGETGLANFYRLKLRDPAAGDLDD